MCSTHSANSREEQNAEAKKYQARLEPSNQSQVKKSGFITEKHRNRESMPRMAKATFGPPNSWLPTPLMAHRKSTREDETNDRHIHGYSIREFMASVRAAERNRDSDPDNVIEQRKFGFD